LKGVGLKPVSPERRDAVLQLAALGTTKAGIARQLALGEATVYRILAAAKGGRARLMLPSLAPACIRKWHFWRLCGHYP
jgi:DNA invertase Pin-like site-specific DNA recombinase